MSKKGTFSNLGKYGCYTYKSRPVNPVNDLIVPSEYEYLAKYM